MDLERLGAMNATRLSFARTLMRVMGRQRWQISCDRFDLNESGHGEVIYRVQTPNVATTLLSSPSPWMMLFALIA